MDILNKEVEHVKFGKGRVISQEADRLSVEFSPQYGTKQFVYPDAFEEYLKFYDADVARSVLEELQAKLALIEAEKVRKNQEYEAATQVKAAEKSAFTAQKRKSSPKSGAAKAKKK